MYAFSAVVLNRSYSLNSGNTSLEAVTNPPAARSRQRPRARARPPRACGPGSRSCAGSISLYLVEWLPSVLASLRR